ncbi:MAG: DUF3135 domain-containing protein [Sulfuricella sp.]|nr:DUF3135 domain-containing protein [Sulfuricella sp.]
MNSDQFPSDTFDFEAWTALARDNPEAFDELRQQHIEDTIHWCCDYGRGNEKRLRGLQWRIDMERMKAHTPLKSCLRVSSMMWDAVYEMQDGLDQYLAEFRNILNAETTAPPSPMSVSARAQVLPFKKLS